VVLPPEKDTEERRSRIERSRWALALTAILVTAGLVFFAVDLPTPGAAALAAGVFVFLIWMFFPYLRGHFELEIGGDTFSARFRGGLTDPVTEVPSATEESEEEPPAPQPPGRLRKLLRWLPQNRGSAEG
jgi:hypothetical protein